MCDCYETLSYDFVEDSRPHAGGRVGYFEAEVGSCCGGRQFIWGDVLPGVPVSLDDVSYLKVVLD